VLRLRGAEEPCLPLCRQLEPHVQIPRCVDGIRDRAMKSHLSVVVVLRHVGLGRTIGFQAAVSGTSGGKPSESSHQLIVKSRCLWRIATPIRQVSELVAAYSL